MMSSCLSLRLMLLALFLSVVNVLGHTGDATWYNTGLGNCGAWSRPTDFIVAIPTGQYDSGHRCWHRLWISYEGRSIHAVGRRLVSELQPVQHRPLALSFHGARTPLRRPPPQRDLELHAIQL
ncbi:hypothetical protein DFP72DRAFT_911073, partial [Ephemerocybe angulata]